MSVETVSNSAPTEETTLRHISNSEVSTWLTCERKYYYNFDLNLAPKKYGQSLSRGLAGHKVLETFYRSLKDNSNYDKAVAAGQECLAQMMQEGYYDLEILVDIARITERYWTFAKKDNWEILAVEAKHAIDLTDEYDYTMRIDVLARVNGELMPIDHKFVYDFYSLDAVNYMPQLPKYLASLRHAGVHANRAMLNMLRWRTKKDAMLDEEMFKRIIIAPSPVVLRHHMREQIMASREIINHRKLPVEERERVVKRNMSKMNCQNCSYKDLCLAQLWGNPIDVEIQINFKPNDYDYNSGDENN